MGPKGSLLGDPNPNPLAGWVPQVNLCMDRVDTGALDPTDELAVLDPRCPRILVGGGVWVVPLVHRVLGVLHRVPGLLDPRCPPILVASSPEGMLVARCVDT